MSHGGPSSSPERTMRRRARCTPASAAEGGAKPMLKVTDWLGRNNNGKGGRPDSLKVAACVPMMKGRSPPPTVRRCSEWSPTHSIWPPRARRRRTAPAARLRAARASSPGAEREAAAPRSFRRLGRRRRRTRNAQQAKKQEPAAYSGHGHHSSSPRIRPLPRQPVNCFRAGRRNRRS